MPEDPYADPVTGVLRNKLGLGTTGELEIAEREITHAALIFLKESPVPPSYDLGHLCAIHRRIFGDIYDQRLSRAVGAKRRKDAETSLRLTRPGELSRRRRGHPGFPGGSSRR